MPEATRRARPLVGALLVLGAAALWGSLGLFGRALFAYHLTPLEIASSRAALAFVFLAILLAPRARTLRVAWRDVPLLLVYGALSIGLFYFLYMAAIERTTIAVAAALLYSAPAFVLVISWALRWEAVRAGQLLPLAAALAGVMLVTGAGAAILRGAAPLPAAAVVFGLGSGVTYALFTVLGKRIAARHGPLRTLFYAYAAGALVLAPAALPWRVIAAHPHALPALIGMSVGPTLLASFLFLTALRHLPASTASMLATAEPVTAALLGVAVLGEPLGLDTAVGVALVVTAGVMLGSARPRRVTRRRRS
ncbi:MAG TPA: EamA family transporter [Longimicrobiales bacterium]|nr:EamA family transporter [Longimicrobiales bacterium]